MCTTGNTLLFLAAVGSVIAPYRGYEVAEGQQDVGYESSLAGPTFGGGRREVYPAVKYVTPHSTGYVEPVGNLYPDPPSYYGAGDHFGVGHGDLPRRVKIQVYRGPTLKSDYTHYAPWGYYVIQPSDGR